MSAGKADQFRKDEKRIALSSVLALRQHSDQLRFGLSNLPALKVGD